MTTARTAAIRGWLAGGGVYFGGVLNRSALGVAGIAAAHRFGISPAQLSVFVIVQLGVYAAMQIPTGLLADRFGSRRLLLISAGLLGAAGTVFAFAPNYPTALAARAALGCGDAITFVSVLRFAATNFSPRRFPLIVSLTSCFPFAGNIAATVPLAFLLRETGWQTTFLIAALIPFGAGILVAIFMSAAKAAPRAATTGDAARAPVPTSVFTRLRTAWSTPGTRLGMWIHFSCMCSSTAFGLLWGYPYLVSMGFTKAAAGGVLLLSVICGLGVVLSVGAVITAHPPWRVAIAFTTAVVIVVLWGLLLAFGGNHPNKLIVTVLAVVVGSGPPIASIGFAVVRDYNRPEIVGTATGVVNCGGFMAAILAVASIGAVLQIIGNTGPSAFRIAFAFAFAIQAYGAFRIIVWWRRVRAQVLRQLDEGLEVPVGATRHRWDPVEVPASRPPAGDGSQMPR